MMRVLRAEVLGMCFGVRDALKAMHAIPNPETVTVHGELVHNEVVLTQLRVRGFEMVDETAREQPATTPNVLITAHGVSHKERARLHAAGKTLIDTTCPLVVRAHDAAQKLEAEGYDVVVIGKPGHVEVQGIVEDLRQQIVVPNLEAVQTYPSHKIGIICQTTTPPPLAQAIVDAIRAKNPQAEVKFSDTICRPTRQHQNSLEELLPQVEAVVVVGGKNSNNTKELVRRVREYGLPALHVVGPEDLPGDWFTEFEVVGLTAGTSTLSETIDAVEARMKQFQTSKPVGCFS
ncbi:MAG: 4-hydroxy-3-methylbut-2-enyl diphosphate reductase [Fimbriiglobus sp.]